MKKFKKLAINGGLPVRDSYLSYGRQSIDEVDVSAVVEVLKSDFLTTGPAVASFEEAVVDYVGAKYAVAVNSGTAALHMAVFAAGIGEGDEVIVPALTFAASSNSVLYCGAKPVFVDIDAITYNIDIEKIEEKITERTKAIIPVDYAGQPCDIDKIRKIADKYNLLIIEDAAHALGSEYKGKKVGTAADLTCFSLHPVKPITTGEGGIVCTDNDKLYERMMLFRTHGITRDEDLLNENHGDWYYEQQILGYNYRLTDIQSALGLSQMNKLDRFIARRRELVDYYNDAFKNLDEIITPFECGYSKSGYHIYVIRLKDDLLKVGRAEVFDALRAENIGVNVHYIPVYLHPYYQKLGYKKGLCPVAEAVYESIITLPLYPSMTVEDANSVVEGVRKVMAYYRK